MTTRTAAIAALLACGGLAAPARAQSLPVGRLAYVESVVERSLAGEAGAARETAPFHIGETLATAGDAMARVDLVSMHVTLGPSSRLMLPDAFVLALRLETGRVQLDSPGRDMMTLLTPEGEVRGRGRIVVRREAGRTLVMCHSGSALVDGGGRSVIVPPAHGTVVRGGAAPAPPTALPEPPSGLWPGSDPAYVEAGKPLELRWDPAGSAYWVEVVPEGGDAAVLQRDASGDSAGVAIPWPGAFRWRVATRDERGLEGLPSRGGMIAVVEQR